MSSKKTRPVKYVRIMALGDERLRKVHSLLDSGCGPFKVARIIQNEWGLCVDVAEKTLINQLARYKADRENKALLAKKTKREVRAVLKGGDVDLAEMPEFPSLTVPPSKRIAVLEKYEEIREIQLGRIKAFTEKEAKMPMPMASINKEVELYVNMLDRIQKAQFDLGVDQFQGPVMQHGSLTRTQTVQAPNGDTLTETTVQAVTTAMGALMRLKGEEPLDAIAHAERETS